MNPYFQLICMTKVIREPTQLTMNIDDPYSSENSLSFHKTITGHNPEDRISSLSLSIKQISRWML
jgi:hypothetical protein